MGDEFSRLGGLKTLAFSGNRLKSVPPCFSHLDAAEPISLQDNRITNLDPLCRGCTFTALRDLDLTNNNIEELPESLGELTCLKALWLTSNKLKTLPNSVGNMKNLEELYANQNRLKKLPDSFGELWSLRYLTFEYVSYPGHRRCMTGLH